MTGRAPAEQAPSAVTRGGPMDSRAVVLRGMSVDCTADHVLRGQGIDPVVARENHRHLIAAAELALAMGVPLLDARAAYRLLPVEPVSTDRVRLDGVVLTGRRPARELRSAFAALVGACSVGDRIDLASRATMDDDPALALALDGLGTAAVMALATRLCHEAEAQARAAGWTAVPLPGPGAPGWPLESGQREVLAAVGAPCCGVSVEEFGRLAPAKSLTVVVAIGPGLGSPRSICETCAMQRRCDWRERERGLWSGAGFREPGNETR